MHALIGVGREILYLVEKYQTVIVVGQTGCGKTTRKQEHCMDHKNTLNNVSLNRQKFLNIWMKRAGQPTVNRWRALKYVKSKRSIYLLVETARIMYSLISIATENSSDIGSATSSG